MSGGRPANVQRIAVFRALQLGDMLCAVPALRALRAAWPSAWITLIGLPWVEVFLSRYASLIDDLMVFPGAEGFPEQQESNAGLPAFYETARSRRFDLAIQLHGSGGPANDIVFHLGARLHAGFIDERDGRRPGWFMPWPDALPETERYTTLMEFIGVTVDDDSLWLPLHRGDYAECEALVRRHGIVIENAVIMHVGAQLPSRRWPAARFAAVAQWLSDAGFEVLLTGTAAEAALVAQVQGAMTRSAVNLAGSTSLGGLAALVDQAALVVCNDTGISHIAAALKTPSVVVACGSDTGRWAPRDPQRHRVLADYPSCRPCGYRSCPFGHECALNISVELVLEAARAQLRTTDAVSTASRFPPWAAPARA